MICIPGMHDYTPNFSYCVVFWTDLSFSSFFPFVLLIVVFLLVLLIINLTNFVCIPYWQNMLILNKQIVKKMGQY